MAITLKIGEQVSVPVTGRKALILDADGDPFLLTSDGTREEIGGGGGGSVESVSGDGVDDTDPANPVIDLADVITAAMIQDKAVTLAKMADLAAARIIGSVAGGVPAALTAAQSLGIVLPDMYRSRIGMDIDGTQNTTRHPSNEQVGLLICRTLTGNRTLTLGVTGAATADIIDILRLDTSGFTLAVNSAAPALLATFPASPTVPTLFRFYFSGGNFTYNVRTFLQAT